MKLIRVFTILFSCTVLFSAELQLPDKHPLDETETRAFTMDNGLKVILVSNPKYNVSAASMNVKLDLCQILKMHKAWHTFWSICFFWEQKNILM